MSNVPDRSVNNEYNSNFEGTVTVEEAGMSGVCKELRGKRLVCNESGDAAHTTVVIATKGAGDGNKAIQKNSLVVERNTGMQLEVDVSRAAGCAMRRKLESAER